MNVVEAQDLLTRPLGPIDELDFDLLGLNDVFDECHHAAEPQQPAAPQTTTSATFPHCDTNSIDAEADMFLGIADQEERELMELLDETVDVNLEDHQELLTLDGGLDGSSQHSQTDSLGKMSFYPLKNKMIMMNEPAQQQQPSAKITPIRSASSSPVAVPSAPATTTQEVPTTTPAPTRAVSEESTATTTTTTAPVSPSSSCATVATPAPQPEAPQLAHPEMALWGDWDVPLGRAQEVREFVGNVRFRDLVERYRPAYHQTTRKPDKTAISMTIFKHISQNGGRFLDKRKAGKRTMATTDSSTKTTTTVFEWYQIPQDKALAKISQALRLGTRPVRKYTAAPQVPEMAGYHYQTSSPSTATTYGYNTGNSGADYHHHHTAAHYHHHHHQYAAAAAPAHQYQYYEEQPSHYASAAPVKFPANYQPQQQPPHPQEHEDAEQSAKR